MCAIAQSEIGTVLTFKHYPVVTLARKRRKNRTLQARSKNIICWKSLGGVFCCYSGKMKVQRCLKMFTAHLHCLVLTVLRKGRKTGQNKMLQTISKLFVIRE